MKISELPAGSIIEIDGDRFELDSNKRDDFDYRSDVKIISVPYAVTLMLATWLDNVYTKTGTPESLIIEACQESAKTKHDAHIAATPKREI